MEALAALSLACNVVQLVDFGLKTTTDIQQIYREQATIQQKNFQASAQELERIGRKIENAINDVQAARPLTKSDQELVTLASKLQDTASDLDKELSQLTAKATGSFREALKKKFKLNMRMAAIKAMKTQLLEFERQLNTRILIELHERSNLVAFSHEDQFRNLQDDLKFFIARLASGFNRLQDVLKQQAEMTRSVIEQEHIITRDHLAFGLQNLRLQEEELDGRRQLMNSLIFPEIFFRQEQIKDAHRETFDWIFDETGEAVLPWSNFVLWLESEDGLYWINGKAGSGKSTLMNFLVCDPRTRQHLDKNRGRKIIMVSFFFWNAGDPMQKTARGLIRSLVYQLLDQDSGLFSALSTNAAILLANSSQLIWSLRRLKILLKEVLNNLSYPICLFIDGLDEFDEDEEELLSIVRLFRELADVKLCVSSRPSQSYEDAFNDCARLKLQDLTSKALKSYINDLLFESPKMKNLKQSDPIGATTLIKATTYKAEGVFLWVEVVIKELLRGLTNKDDLYLLHRRLESMPGEIEGLYDRMWKRYDQDLVFYREEASLFFNLVLHEELSLIKFSVAANEKVQAEFLDDLSYHLSDREAETKLQGFRSTSTYKNVLETCITTESRLISRCGGLLECQPLPFIPFIRDVTFRPFPSKMLASHDSALYESIQERCVKRAVKFSHRTARDFVLRALEVQQCSWFRRMAPAECKSRLTRGRCALWLMNSDAVDNIDAYDEIVTTRSGLDGFWHDNMSDIIQVTNWWRDHELMMKTMKTIGIDRQKPNSAYRESRIAVDLLGLAAECGHPSFVDQYIQPEFRHSKEYLTYLLGCACATNPKPKIITALFKLGANVRERIRFDSFKPFHSASPWIVFINWMWCALTEGQSHDQTNEALAFEDIEKALGVFLEHDGDLQAVLPMALNSNSWNERLPPHIHLVVSVNLMFILRYFFAEQESFQRFETDHHTSVLVETCDVILMGYGCAYEPVQWYRVQSFTDSQLLQKDLVFFNVTAMKNSHIFNLVLDPPPVTLYNEIAERCQRLSDEDPKMEVEKIPCWTKQMMEQAIHSMRRSKESYEGVIKRLEIPVNLFMNMVS